MAPHRRPLHVLLINPPYQTITSNIGVGHQTPLGLLCVGGALLDAGHRVTLLDAEARHLGDPAIVQRVREVAAQVVMIGHAGSTPAHPTCVRLLNAIKAARPEAVTVYGGVWPTYHDERVLIEHPCVDVVVRGEGEATAVGLVNALAERGADADDLPLRGVAGTTFRDWLGEVVRNPDRPPIERLDDYRIGWELIEDWRLYRCFGLGRAAIIQFSRGCPHRCTYCGQHGFWVQWRHRDPAQLVDEIERLHRQHGVRFITLADENPTTLKHVWRDLLERIIEKNLDVHFFATIRATDLVRDADIMHLYRDAGILYVLMGIESTDDAVLREVRKKSNGRVDFRACQLLREHRIYSVIGYITGLGGERWRDFARAGRVLAAYDGDFLNAMYVTPHSWTPYAMAQADRAVVEPDQARWDYRHQVLATDRMRPWEVFTAVKLVELWFHLRPRRLWRMAFRSRLSLGQTLWTTLHVGGVWVAEIADYLARPRGRTARGRPLRETLGRPPATEQPGVPITLSAGRRRSRDRARPARIVA
ncbi:MAG: radical SAM protein [Planctomycetota bacterium]